MEVVTPADDVVMPPSFDGALTDKLRFLPLPAGTPVAPLASLDEDDDVLADAPFSLLLLFRIVPFLPNVDVSTVGQLSPLPDPLPLAPRDLVCLFPIC